MSENQDAQTVKRVGRLVIKSIFLSRDVVDRVSFKINRELSTALVRVHGLCNEADPEWSKKYGDQNDICARFWERQDSGIDIVTIGSRKDEQTTSKEDDIALLETISGSTKKESSDSSSQSLRSNASVDIELSMRAPSPVSELSEGQSNSPEVQTPDSEVVEAPVHENKISRWKRNSFLRWSLRKSKNEEEQNESVYDDVNESSPNSDKDDKHEEDKDNKDKEDNKDEENDENDENDDKEKDENKDSSKVLEDLSACQESNDLDHGNVTDLMSSEVVNPVSPFANPFECSIYSANASPKKEIPILVPDTPALNPTDPVKPMQPAPVGSILVNPIYMGPPPTSIEVYVAEEAVTETETSNADLAEPVRAPTFSEYIRGLPEIVRNDYSGNFDYQPEFKDEEDESNDNDSDEGYGDVSHVKETLNSPIEIGNDSPNAGSNENRGSRIHKLYSVFRHSDK